MSSRHVRMITRVGGTFLLSFCCHTRSQRTNYRTWQSIEIGLIYQPGAGMLFVHRNQVIAQKNSKPGTEFLCKWRYILGSGGRVSADTLQRHNSPLQPRVCLSFLVTDPDVCDFGCSFVLSCFRLPCQGATSHLFSWRLSSYFTLFFGGFVY